MQQNREIHGIITCGNYKRLPREIKLYYSPKKADFQITSRKRMALGHDRMLFTGIEIVHTDGIHHGPIQSLRELPRHVLGVLSEDFSNPAQISRIELYAEDATFVMELNPDGSLSECSYHFIGPGWDFPVYEQPDGKQPDLSYDRDNPTWGFTRYDPSETH